MNQRNHRCGVYEWRGKQFIGARAVANAAGVTPQTVIGMLNKHGNLDRLGIGSFGHSSGKPGNPVQVGPHKFPSQVALSQAVGLSESSISRRLKSGQVDEIIARLMASDVRAA